MIKTEKSIFRSYKNSLIKNKIPFDLYINLKSTKIVGGLGPPRFTGETLDLKYMGFINRVKSSVKKRIKSGDLQVEKARNMKVDYFGYNLAHKVNMASFTGCMEIDINSAYWRTAYMLGIISRDIYMEGEKLAKLSRDPRLPAEERDMLKSVRMIALGTLAKKTIHYRFDGKKLFRMPDKQDKGTMFFWNKICLHTAKVMKGLSVAAGEDYLFYWVDAIFIKEGKQEKIKKLIKEAGYEFKTKEIKKVSFKKGEIVADKKKFMLSVNKEKSIL